jgi:hypothetical protein
VSVVPGFAASIFIFISLKASVSEDAAKIVRLPVIFGTGPAAGVPDVRVAVAGVAPARVAVATLAVVAVAAVVAVPGARVAVEAAVAAADGAADGAADAAVDAAGAVLGAAEATAALVAVGAGALVAVGEPPQAASRVIVRANRANRHNVVRRISPPSTIHDRAPGAIPNHGALNSPCR